VIDGNGNVWAANSGNNSITELNSSGSPISGSNGYIGGTSGTNLNGLYGIAVDGAGNLWVTNNGGGSVEGISITEFVGAASPVVTPVVGNLPSPYGSSAGKTAQALSTSRDFRRAPPRGPGGQVFVSGVDPGSAWVGWKPATRVSRSIGNSTNSNSRSQ